LGFFNTDTNIGDIITCNDISNEISNIELNGIECKRVYLDSSTQLRELYNYQHLVEQKRKEGNYDLPYIQVLHVDIVKYQMIQGDDMIYGLKINISDLELEYRDHSTFTTFAQMIEPWGEIKFTAHKHISDY